jgi:hypothetical protein
MRICGNDEQITEMATALAKAQGEFGTVDKGATNPFFNSKYADLASILKAVTPILSKNGLCLLTPPKTIKGEGMVEVECILLHTSGGRIETNLSGKVDASSKNIMHAIGSAVTYLRRYSVQGLLNIACDVDDDGNAAGGVQGNQNRRVK